MIAIAQHADGSVPSVCRPITYHCNCDTVPAKPSKAIALFVKDLQSAAQAGVRFGYRTFCCSEIILYSLHLESVFTGK
jgi:hypothetical protein